MLCSSRHLFTYPLILATPAKSCLTGSIHSLFRLLDKCLDKGRVPIPGLKKLAARPVVRLARFARCCEWEDNATTGLSVQNLVCASCLFISLYFLRCFCFWTWLLFILLLVRNKLQLSHAAEFASSTFHFPVATWWLGCPGTFLSIRYNQSYSLRQPKLSGRHEKLILLWSNHLSSCKSQNHSAPSCIHENTDCISDYCCASSGAAYWNCGVDWDWVPIFVVHPRRCDETTIQGDIESH